MAIQIDALKTALENEMRERDFYIAQSEKTTLPIGKKMFLQIAADEDEHYRRLQTIHEELSRQGTWPETVAQGIGSSDIRKTFQQIADRAEKTPEAGRDDIQALEIAAEFEAKGYDFYTRLAGEAESEPEKMFFKILASMEWEHMLTLKDALLFYESPVDWYTMHEKPHYEA
jgi:rubrerythrin